MVFLDLVKRRQSLRKYLSRPVSRKVIERCLEAARLAPSACNSQPWSFVVVDESGLKAKFTEAVFSGIYSMNSFAKAAPVIIAVITEKSSYAAKVGGFLKGTQYSLIDIGIATEHLILQAEEEGLGTCWLGWFDEKKAKKILNIPKNKKIDILISLGYPETKELRDKNRKSLDEIRKYNSF